MPLSCGLRDEERPQAEEGPAARTLRKGLLPSLPHISLYAQIFVICLMVGVGSGPEGQPALTFTGNFKICKAMPWVRSFGPPYLPREVGAIMFPFYTEGNRGPEWLGDLPRFTQLISLKDKN